jgi:hypothetical protein
MYVNVCEMYVNKDVVQHNQCFISKNSQYNQAHSCDHSLTYIISDGYITIIYK